MLVLTLRPGESLKIGDDTVIRVLDTGRKSLRVRVGVDAPPETKILRENTERNSKGAPHAPRRAR